MKAISLRPEWAMAVMLGWKTIECRTWKTDYRGDLLICSSNKPLDGAIHGHALCIVTLCEVRPFSRGDLDAAMLDDVPEGAFAWELGSVRLIEPFAVKGKLSLFEVDHAVSELGAPSRDVLDRLYLPLVYHGRDSEADAIWAEVLEGF